ncbi:Xanthine dehydrogenase C subunit [Trema orientale]|uniref:Xanthine dehydrogenase C subunit n=1 Tax=Trema orientale TaxID=63057 RepID=A0A2P5FTG2_TREOI|nr:Xanthine dehydrogenase C subunit [Trema orientale]
MSNTRMFPLAILLLLNISVLSKASDSVYNTFLQCLQNQTNPTDRVSNSVYSQSNSSYDSVLQAYIRNARYNTSSTNKPLLIVTASHVSHVQGTVLCSKKINLQLKIRSGGHDYAGISYVSEEPFVILDMFQLQSVSVDVADQSVWVGAGATLGELYYRIWEKSRVLGFPAGVCPTVGAGGHISGGGYGNLLRKYGLAVDHVLDAQIVNVNGEILDRKSMGEDLFWAIRGGGAASFGVVLSYKLRLVPVPKTVTVFRVERILDQDPNVTDLVYQWQQVAPTTNDDLFMRMLIQPISSRVKRGQRTIRATVITEYLGNADDLVSLLAKEFPLLGLKKEDCIQTSWIDSVVWWANFDNGTNPNVLLDRNLNSANFLIRKSDYVQTPISKDGLEWLWKRMTELGKTGFVFNPYGGKMNEISASETPFPHRAGNLYKIQYSVNWDEADIELEKNYTTQIRRLFSYMTPFVSKNPRSAFLNYRDLDIGVNNFGKDSYEEGKVYGVKYFGDNFDRLVKVKTAVDPENFFRNEQSIPTSPSKA